MHAFELILLVPSNYEFETDRDDADSRDHEPPFATTMDAFDAHRRIYWTGLNSCVD
jgi:hypothetical protein